MNTSVHHPNDDGVVTREFYTSCREHEEGEVRAKFEAAGFQNIQFSDRTKFGAHIKYDGPTVMNKEQREFILKF